MLPCYHPCDLEVQITKQLQARHSTVHMQCDVHMHMHMPMHMLHVHGACGVNMRWSDPRHAPRRSPPQESLHGSVVTDFAGHAYELRTVHSMQTEP